MDQLAAGEANFSTSIHFEARLKPLGWSSPIDLCAAGGKNPGFGLFVSCNLCE
jgi:hypothetical protein